MPPFSVNVPGSKLKLKSVEGWYRMVDGKDKVPKLASCAERGILMTGAAFVETTRVAFKVTDPV
jgi:hypothetical protein